MHWNKWLTYSFAAAGFTAAVVMAPAAEAMPTVQEYTAPADPTLEDVRTRAIEAYVVRRGLKARTEAAAAARRQLEALPPALMAVAPIVGTAVAGAVEVPIVPVTFSDTTTPPYQSAAAALRRSMADRTLSPRESVTP